jgi:hypothetical protein
MNTDKRQHPRLSLKGVHANITISNALSEDSIHLEGDMVDMSYSGIRIKLLSEMPQNLPASNVKIVLTLPNSDISCTIKGAIRHISNNAEVGMHYRDYHKEDDVDAFMFECVKHIDTPTHHII